MYLGRNIQYLRKQRKITQEGFSEQMAVSRQTVAKWEAGDVIPELGKLLYMKTSGPTSIGQLIEILDQYGIRHAERNIRISKKNPKPYKYSILTVHANGGYTHWVLFYHDKYYDPEFGLIEGEYTYGKITSFLEIYEG